MWLVFGTAFPAYAIDSPNLYGASFPVDEITKVDAVSVRVVIGAEVEIVRRDDIGAFAAQKTFENPSRARLLPQSVVEQFAKAALEANDKKRLSWVAQGLCARFTSDEVAVIGFLSSQASAPLFREVLKELVDLPQRFAVPEELVPRILVWVGVRDPLWARGRIGALQPTQLSLMRESLKSQILEALGGRHFPEADELLALQRELFGEQGQEFRGLRVFASRLSAAVTAARSADVEPAFSLAAVTRSDAELYPIAVGVMLETAHQQAEAEISRGKYGAALLILSRIDFDRRTPTSHDLTLQALEGAISGAHGALDDVRVEQYLISVAAADERIKRVYLEALQAQALRALHDGKTEAAIDAIRRVTGIRADPSEDNDVLRFALGRAMLSGGDLDAARQVISEIQTGVGLKRLLILAWNGYFGNILYGLLVASGVVLLGGVIYLATKIDWAALRPEPRPQQHPQEPVEEDDDKDRPTGFSIVSARLFTPAMQEYHRCLEGLGLKPGASLAEIKKRYRNLVKKVHPDLNQNLSAEDKDRFVALTKIYDRVMELRDELKISE